METVLIAEPLGCWIYTEADVPDELRKMVSKTVQARLDGADRRAASGCTLRATR